MRVKVAGLLKSPVGTVSTYRINEDLSLEGDGGCLLQGDANLVRTRKGVMVTARFRVQVTVMCSRCLSMFESPLSLDLQEEFLTGPAVNIPLAPGEEAFVITKGRELDLGEAVRQYVALEVPLKPLCRSRCAGLCPRCGRNLNHESRVCSLVEAVN